MSDDELPDVNVLLALAWTQHVHHTAATEWFDRDPGLSWATTTLTELGFVRISSNPSFTDEAVTPLQAVELLRLLTMRARHQRWLDDLQFQDDAMPWSSVNTHRQVTDARLVALARRHGGRLVTFDSRLRDLTEHEALIRVLEGEP